MCRRMWLYCWYIRWTGSTEHNEIPTLPAIVVTPRPLGSIQWHGQCDRAEGRRAGGLESGDMMVVREEKGLGRIAEVAQFKKDNQYCVFSFSRSVPLPLLVHPLNPQGVKATKYGRVQLVTCAFQTVPRSFKVIQSITRHYDGFFNSGFS